MLSTTIEEILQNQINTLYGKDAGRQTGKVLIPAFLGDFRKVLEGSDLGRSVTEEYMTEDRKLHLVLTGQRRLSAQGTDLIISSCKCNDMEVLTREVSIFPKIM